MALQSGGGGGGTSVCDFNALAPSAPTVAAPAPRRISDPSYWGSSPLYVAPLQQPHVGLGGWLVKSRTHSSVRKAPALAYEILDRLVSLSKPQFPLL